VSEREVCGKRVGGRGPKAKKHRVTSANNTSPSRQMMSSPQARTRPRRRASGEAVSLERRNTLVEPLLVQHGNAFRRRAAFSRVASCVKEQEAALFMGGVRRGHAQHDYVQLPEFLARRGTTLSLHPRCKTTGGRQASALLARGRALGLTSAHSFTWR